MAKNNYQIELFRNFQKTSLFFDDKKITKRFWKFYSLTLRRVSK
jgi:hypothetical protein